MRLILSCFSPSPTSASHSSGRSFKQPQGKRNVKGKGIWVLLGQPFDSFTSLSLGGLTVFVYPEAVYETLTPGQVERKGRGAGLEARKETGGKGRQGWARCTGVGEQVLSVREILEVLLFVCHVLAAIVRLGME